jgi:tRNA uracil 4-sulfurtransferase
MIKQTIVHYGELGLKGRNRINFERRLVDNIHTALGDLGDATVQRSHGYLVVTSPEGASEGEVEARLRRIPGIAYFAPVTTTPLDMAAISKTAVLLAREVITTEAQRGSARTSFRVRCTRGNKQFPHTSPEVAREVGAQIVAATGAPVDLADPDVTIAVQIYEDEAYIFAHRIPGLGGLPVGSSGRVIVLFSGGIDSPVAAHLMMKRGCTVDFVHFHLLRGSQQIHEAKVVAMARQVLAPHRVRGRLFMISAAPFEAAMTPLDSRVATVVFRRFITRAAERVATYRKAPALVTGDSVGQVASQTLTNINVITRATRMPILRPLIGMDKQEIIAIAKEIGTYELSVQPYQDPCSIHAQRPATRARLEDIHKVEDQIDIDAVLKETLEHHVEELRISFDEA